ncbi:MAG: acetylglutamate kinase [Balneola sp.]|nr:acetylglutamate kinase [Balneola sp.]MBO6712154.1 acetylglutamate kinase [Balneola sp.]MBO6800348.1 acetylglutamate kinase [Balneola sp.]MBO6869638.1 acetylglutamate kinase [Balneola sp.]
MSEIKVIKIGGKVIDDQAKLDQFLQDFAQIEERKILVHGGGKIASDVAEKLGQEPKMINGRRITDANMIDVVTMVYGGLVNKKIVAKLQVLGCNAIGLSGADMNLIQSKKRDPEPIDFGFVGDIEQVDTTVLNSLLNEGITPVIAPLTHDGNGQLLNTNADNIAGFIASGLADHGDVAMDLCFDLEGVMNGERLITEMNLLLYRHLEGNGIIKEGMIPKLDLGFKALNAGTKKVRIVGFDVFKEEEKGTRLVR